ncbi:MAG: hypothetical protein WCF42_10825 [Terriglobales bacterium]
MSSNEWLPSAFDGLEGKLRKREGLERAMTPPLRQALLKSCITYLRLLATSREDMEVTADDAGRFLESTGLPANALGNSAGCLFRGKCWEFHRAVEAKQPCEQSSPREPRLALPPRTRGRP